MSGLDSDESSEGNYSQDIDTDDSYSCRSVSTEDCANEPLGTKGWWLLVARNDLEKHDDSRFRLLGRYSRRREAVAAMPWWSGYSFFLNRMARIDAFCDRPFLDEPHKTNTIDWKEPLPRIQHWQGDSHAATSEGSDATWLLVARNDMVPSEPLKHRLLGQYSDPSLAKNNIPGWTGHSFFIECIPGLNKECDEPFLNTGPNTVIPMDPSKPYPSYTTSTHGNGAPWVSSGSLRQQ